MAAAVTAWVGVLLGIVTSVMLCLALYVGLRL